MEYATIVAERRVVLGKKVKQLRREGVLPANVFGKGLESKALQMDGREFLRTVRASGIRSMYKLTIQDEAEARYVFIRGLMREGGMGAPRHVDFYQVDLTKPIETSVPLHLIGESPAVRDLAGTLRTEVQNVRIRTMPLNVPSFVEADLSMIKGFEISLTVANITVPAGIELVDHPEVVVATVMPPRLRLTEDEEAAED